MIGVNKHKKKVKGKGMCDRHATVAFGVSNDPSPRPSTSSRPEVSGAEGGRGRKRPTWEQRLSKSSLKKEAKTCQEILLYIEFVIKSTSITFEVKTICKHIFCGGVG